MSYSTRERIGHVVRRLGMGAHGPVASSLPTVDEAIADSLDLSDAPTHLPEIPTPRDVEEAQDLGKVGEVIAGWLDAMRRPTRRIEERLTWFWHDHFSVAARKVRAYNLVSAHLNTLRTHATGRFDELLRATATDGAMLLYLDGARSRRDQVNENYAREVMELHTIGIGQYTQDDITNAARAATGWIVGIPGRRLPDRVEPWSTVLVPFRHDNSIKTIFDTSGRFGMDDLIDLLLDHPATARRIAAKLFEHLVGHPATETQVDHLASVFAADWQIMRLVEEIAADPAFTADAALRTKVRTPVERAISIAQGFRPADEPLPEGFPLLLSRLGYVPFAPPNPAGFPTGSTLIGPYQLVHSLDLLAAVGEIGAGSTRDVRDRLGLFDLSRTTELTLDRAVTPEARVALAASSPEFGMT